MSSHRITKIHQSLQEKQADAILVTNPKNIRYLAGFIGLAPDERESILLITHNNAQLITSRMYAERAHQMIREDVALIIDTEGKGIFKTALELLSEKQIILCESTDLSLAEYDRLIRMTSATITPTSGLVEKLRIIKDEEEIAELKKATKITDEVFMRVVALLKENDPTTFTERDIAEFMRKTGYELGADGFGFDPIVASGAGTSEPHYITSTKKIEKNTPFLLDFGFQVNGYTADLSRTIYIGKASDEFKKTFDLVFENNESRIKNVKPGISTRKLYDESVDFFKQHDVNDYYLHSLGHGVGLDVHENPSVGRGDGTMLEPGMVITIEPGLYYAGIYGVRIEDVVLVKKNGAEVLSSDSTKTLIEIGV